MELYLLKSTACMALLFVFYKLFLERQNMHHFKRFYLLGSVLVSLVIPFITFTNYVEVTPIPVPDVVFQEEFVTAVYQEKSINYGLLFLLIIYGIGLLFFLLKFSKNLRALIVKIKKNPRFKNDSFVHVLLKNPTTPHTFLKYIFFDRKKYEALEIPEEVILHEEAHAKEKHSLDLLFIEILQVVFWFNPLVYFIKKSIRLNHEFLADRAVLKQGVEASNYQNLLLGFSSNSNTPAMANSINYSSIKKRFTVMKTETSRGSAWLRSLLLLPLLAVLIYGFSTTETVEKISEENETTTSIASHQSKILELSIFEDLTIIFGNTRISLNEIEKFINPLDFSHVAINAAPNVPEEFREQVLSKMVELGLGDGMTYCTPLQNYYNKEEFEKEARLVGKTTRATNEQLAKYNKMASYWNQYFVENPDDKNIPSAELRKLETIYHIMSSEQKHKAEPFPECDLTLKRAPQNYTKQYLEGAERNNKKAFVLMVTTNEIILNGKLSSLETFTSDLDAITKEWEETDYTSAYPSILIASSSEQFIEKLNKEFRKTHYSKANEGLTIRYNQDTAKKEKATPEQLAEYNKLAKKYNTMDRNNMHILGKELTRLNYIYSLMTPKQKKNAEPYPNIPPPPPPPPAPEAPAPVKVIKGVNDMDKNVPPPPPPTKTIKMVNGSAAALPSPAVGAITPITAEQDKLKENIRSIKVNGKTIYSHTKNGQTNYYDRFGNRVDENGTQLTPPPPPPAPQDPVIDLTDMIKKGAQFYYNDKKISTSKAKELVNNLDAIGRVQVVKNKNGKPEVYFWKK